ncbi:MAG: transcription elongation GreA/GreB family factor [Ulvibacter sp.]|jgi:transcription elongation GreA/GreB family factor
MISKELKTVLLGKCSQEVEHRYQKIKEVLDDIKVSLLEESKSSAGDKHETGRAMLQIERENAGRQLKEIENLQSLIRKIDIHAVSNYARLGNLVYTNHGTYFISISIGEVCIDSSNYFCVSLHSPIGNLLSGKIAGEEFTLNQKVYTVTNVT